MRALKLRLRAGVAAVGVVSALLLAVPAMAGAEVLKIASDPFTQVTCKGSATTNHQTMVEPDTFSDGSTIVATFQVGRIYDGGSCDIGFATSTNNGSSWTTGLLPGITKRVGSGPNDRASDPSVAYDAAHKVWLISSLTLLETGGVDGGNSIVTSRSTDGGLTWSNPSTTATGSALDKNWIVCDNTATSRFYGHCYTEWDNSGAGNLLQMSMSADGGLSWSVPATNDSGVIGGQPVVRPNGTVIVPIDDANETAVGAFSSTNGGASWSAVTTIATIRHHTVAGSLRESPLPSAEVDGQGRVYVAWADCSFRQSCATNDIVLSHSTNPTGTSWSSVSRIPIDSQTSGVDHFIPGLAVNKTTSGSSAHLGLTYYFYPAGTTRLAVGFVSSANSGRTWSTRTALATGMPSRWVATTSQGRMVGDYISTSYGSDNLAHGVFATASAPTTGSGTSCTTTGLDNCAEPMDTFTVGLSAGGSASGASSEVLFSGSKAKAHSLWKVVDNNGAKHRD